MSIKIKPNVSFLLEIIGKCGGISRGLAEEIGIKYKRLNQLENNGYIKKEKFYIKEDFKTKTKYIYTIGDIGKKYLKDKNICTHVQQLNGYEHTIKSELVYLELRKTNCAQNILNEQEQRYSYFSEEIQDMNKIKFEYSICDFCIVNEKEFEFIEVVTKNYRKRDFVKKENYCTQFQKIPKYI